MYGVELDNQPRRFLRKAPEILSERITEKLNDLRNNPVPQDAKRLHGSLPLWRVRVGDYRILYYISYEKNRIVIAQIDHRSRVYG